MGWFLSLPWSRRRGMRQDREWREGSRTVRPCTQASGSFSCSFWPWSLPSVVMAQEPGTDCTAGTLSILVAESEIQTLQHLLKSTHKNNSKTRSTDCLFGVWCATLFNIATQFKLNLSSIGDICVAGRGARVQITYQPACFSCFNVPADHLGFSLTCTFWFISSARDLRSAFLTSAPSWRDYGWSSDHIFRSQFFIELQSWAWPTGMKGAEWDAWGPSAPNHHHNDNTDHSLSTESDAVHKEFAFVTVFSPHGSSVWYVWLLPNLQIKKKKLSMKKFSNVHGVSQ